MTKKIGYAFIGCGRVAGRHAEAIRHSKSAKLVAVCDLIESRAHDLASQDSVPFYTNYHEMILRHPEIDVISIITPSGMHAEHAIDVMTRYRKHVVVEKPMAMTPAQAVQMKLAANQSGVRLFPIFQNRFNKAVQRVKMALGPSGELGQLRVGTIRLRWCRPQRYYDQGQWRATWAMDGGALTNQGIHYIDLLRYLCGEVRKVNAITATLGAKIKVEDTAVATLEFESGALGVVEIMTSARPNDFEASISCIGSEGLAVISGIATNELQTFSPDPLCTKDWSEAFPTVYGFGHDVVLEGVAQSILTGRPSPVEFEDGLQTLRLLHAIYKSDEERNWLSLSGDVQSRRLGTPDETLAAQYRTPLPSGFANTALSKDRYATEQTSS